MLLPEVLKKVKKKKFRDNADGGWLSRRDESKLQPPGGEIVIADCLDREERVGERKRKKDKNLLILLLSLSQ